MTAIHNTDDTGNHVDYFFTKIVINDTDLSLQYFFISDLIFTHIRISSLKSYKINTIEKVSSLLSILTSKESYLSQLNKISRRPVRPLIIKGYKMDDLDKLNVKTQKQLEYEPVKDLFHNYDIKNHLLLYNNFVGFNNDIPYSSKSPVKKIKPLKLFIEFLELESSIFKTPSALPIDICLLKENGDKFENTKQVQSFNFISYGDSYVYIKKKPHAKDLDKLSITKAAPNSHIIENLNKILHKKDDKDFDMLNNKVTTTIIFSNYYNNIKKLYNEEINQNIEVLLRGNYGENDKMKLTTNTTYDNNKTEQTRIVLQLMNGYSDDTLYTTFNIFDRTEKDLDNKDDKDDKNKKKQLSPSKITLFIVLIVGKIAIILLIIYIIYKKRTRKYKRNYKKKFIKINKLTKN